MEKIDEVRKYFELCAKLYNFLRHPNSPQFMMVQKLNAYWSSAGLVTSRPLIQSDKIMLRSEMCWKTVPQAMMSTLVLRQRD